MAVLLLLVGAVPAMASKASYTPEDFINGPEFPGDREPSFISVAGGKEANRVTLSKRGRRHVITDRAGIKAGKRCRQVSRVRVSCPKAESLYVELGAGDDRANDGGLGASLAGGRGNDRLVASGDMIGDQGADILRARKGKRPSTTNGAQRLEGEAGDDRLAGGARSEILIGGTGGDTVQAGAGNDQLQGDDYVSDELEPDVIDGGTGRDTLDWDTRGAAVTFDLTDDAPEGAAGEDEFVTSVENVATGEGADRLVGGPEANRFDAGAGSDSVSTGDGNDVFVNDAEVDTLDLGPGSDTVSFANADDGQPVRVDLTDPAPDGLAGAEEALTGVENVIGGEAEDVLIGDGAANLLVGGNATDTLSGAGGGDHLVGDTRDELAAQYVGDDRLSGGDGDDVLEGGESSDILDGGLGNDVLIGYRRSPRGPDAYKGVDVADYSTRTAAITANTASGGGESGEQDTYIGITGITGGSGNDLLTGRNSDKRRELDVLRGEGGNDRLDGRGGRDRLFGGVGDDLLLARDGFADSVNCGAGADSGRADAEDRLVECEPAVVKG
jgi:Ca2+-binding RTX toxin-like protein